METTIERRPVEQEQTTTLVRIEPSPVDEILDRMIGEVRAGRHIRGAEEAGGKRCTLGMIRHFLS